jgi:hypothetical protein
LVEGARLESSIGKADAENRPFVQPLAVPASNPAGAAAATAERPRSIALPGRPEAAECERTAWRIGAEIVYMPEGVI